MQFDFPFTFLHQLLLVPPDGIIATNTCQTCSTNFSLETETNVSMLSDLSARWRHRELGQHYVDTSLKPFPAVMIYNYVLIVIHPLPLRAVVDSTRTGDRAYLVSWFIITIYLAYCRLGLLFILTPCLDKNLIYSVPLVLVIYSDNLLPSGRTCIFLYPIWSGIVLKLDCVL